MGRRKIEMKMVKDSSSRQVTFSKRRTGLFKKANELATLCAVQVSIIVFSPGGKPFSFGNPSVTSITERFLNKGCARPKDANLRMDKLNKQLNGTLRELEVEKKKGEILQKMMTWNEKRLPAEKANPIDEPNLEELLKMKMSLEVLQEILRTRVSEMEASSSLLLLSRNGLDEN
ncbi:hypothetical protein K2173_006527 [Erythroxylum novogranatense]|uniref:MADS-box domain-containing protein n=1 Tax=Erythroxylum novogranatense TaxID=1862640 RepID=A0AAV8T6S5_9ROSI|nr:hypothetical protein K2173_006527 [Erythroxylum novogranatense]